MYLLSVASVLWPLASAGSLLSSVMGIAAVTCFGIFLVGADNAAPHCSFAVITAPYILCT